MERTCSSFDTSVFTSSDRRPESAIEDNTGAAASESRRSAMTTSAPWAAKAIAICPPIPRAPPVTTAILPSSCLFILPVLDSQLNFLKFRAILDEPSLHRELQGDHDHAAQVLRITSDVANSNRRAMTNYRLVVLSLVIAGDSNHVAINGAKCRQATDSRFRT